METTFTPWSGFAGGLMIGLAAVLLLLANGRIAGVSGIVGGIVMRVPGDVAWRVAFVIGLWSGMALFWLARGALPAIEVSASTPVMLAAGLLVGWGTRLAGGCTSGHGVCGIARLSRRSITATVTFMGAAIVTTYLARHVFA